MEYYQKYENTILRIKDECKMNNFRKVLSMLLSLSIIAQTLIFTGCGTEENTSLPEVSNVEEEIKETEGDDEEKEEEETEEKETEEETEKPDEDANDKKDETKNDSEDKNSKDIVFKLTNGNSWPEGGVTIYQLDGTVTNKQSDTISNWKVTDRKSVV